MSKPTLVFAPAAWAKVKFLCHHHKETEVAFLLINRPGDPLYIDDVYVPKQEVTAVTYNLAEDALTNYAFDIMDRYPEGGVMASGNMQGHTHPGNSATPSGTDEADFNSGYGRGWAVMFILARGGETYARLRVKDPVQQDIVMAVEVDWKGWVEAGATPLPDVAAWWAQYDGRVTKKASVWTTATTTTPTGKIHYRGYDFTPGEWAQFNSQDYKPKRPARHRYARASRDWRDEEEVAAASAWVGTEVLCETVDGHGMQGVVVEDDGNGWLTIRDSITGSLFDVEEDEVIPVSDFGDDDEPATLDDVAARLESRAAEVDCDTP